MQSEDILNDHLYSSLYRDIIIVNRAEYIMTFLAEVINDNKNNILIFRL